MKIVQQRIHRQHSAFRHSINMRAHGVVTLKTDIFTQWCLTALCYSSCDTTHGISCVTHLSEFKCVQVRAISPWYPFSRALNNSSGHIPDTWGLHGDQLLYKPSVKCCRQVWSNVRECLRWISHTFNLSTRFQTKPLSFICSLFPRVLQRKLCVGFYMIRIKRNYSNENFAGKCA